MKKKSKIMWCICMAQHYNYNNQKLIIFNIFNMNLSLIAHEHKLIFFTGWNCVW